MLDRVWVDTVNRGPTILGEAGQVQVCAIVV